MSHYELMDCLQKKKKTTCIANYFESICKFCQYSKPFAAELFPFSFQIVSFPQKFRLRLSICHVLFIPLDAAFLALLEVNMRRWVTELLKFFFAQPTVRVKHGFSLYVF